MTQSGDGAVLDGATPQAGYVESAGAEGRTILIADDDRSIRTVLTQALGRAGYEVRTTGHAATLWTWVADGAGDLVITDVVMPDENGLDLIPRIKKIRPDLRIIVMSAQNTLLTAVKATERGAFEYLPKPFDLTELVNVVRRALSMPHGPAAPSVAGLAEDEDALPLIGRSSAMQEIYRTLARLMTTDLTVMITGESGTGKELVARALHDYGKRRAGPFVAVNMAAIPRDLIESELFGHEKGAFTGATTRGVGRFEQADGGTLFLDEIGDMPPEAQTRLLRVLQENEYTTVGGRLAVRANVRIVAATHRDLTQHIRQGLFREDLYYRLNVVPIRLPPLRERAGDIPELARHFLAQVTEEGLPRKSLDGAAMDRLKRHRWPGNVRELENLVRRLAALYSQETIGLDVIEAELATAPSALASGGGTPGEGLSALVERHLREHFAAHPDGLPAAGLHDRVLREVERPLIGLSLEATRGNQIRAAQLLGLNRNTLRKKIRELDIQVVRGVR
ncbi:nitrogen regulation protein NR(I) [Roseospira visakhapatnamensis]|uniref:DNA-binding transcriptional regulator NtrC n=1 Tax=Roseospira visakhapatnamensis TaxID=390880 RepID=A0A7W6W8S9_9PROT|nr:nitrogen regulation protein NR(I) [Roseospira visakhapatnamensis]MBB4265340.1 two-component system nitrogen regulation response regulator GlnG [Roseospira visakhapatnamensis]